MVCSAPPSTLHERPPSYKCDSVSFIAEVPTMLVSRDGGIMERLQIFAADMFKIMNAEREHLDNFLLKDMQAEKE